MNKVDDKQNGIDVSKLKWSSIDPSKEPTTQEKLRKQMAQMAQSGDKFEW